MCNNFLAESFDALNGLYRLQERKVSGKQKLIDDLVYTTIDDVMTNHEPIIILGLSNTEKLLSAYQQAGFMNDNDQVILPKGTVLTYKKTADKSITYRSIHPKTKEVRLNKVIYDIYYVQGKPDCLIAVDPTDVVDLFGPDPYKEGSIK